MTFTNISEFSRGLEADIDQVEKDAVEQAKEIAREFIARAWPPASEGGRTPVDTGRTFSNWQIGIAGRPLTSEPRFKDPIGVALRKLDRMKRLKDIFINNATPYFVYLEEGRSGQAPSGIVEVTLEELRAIYG